VPEVTKSQTKYRRDAVTAPNMAVIEGLFPRSVKGIWLTRKGFEPLVQ
jgi:hypothetical protein